MNIIFEDNHLIVVEKPPGILSQKDKTGSEDVSSRLKKYLKEKLKIQRRLFLTFYFHQWLAFEVI